MRYRIALCGFSEFEHRAMHFSFLHPSGFSESSYDLVDALAEADFAVVDADSKPAVTGVVESGRVAQSVFVGTEAPAGAAWHLRRPIDPSRILRTLDKLTTNSRRIATTPKQDPGVFGELPTLSDVVVLPHAAIEAATVMPPEPAAASHVAAKAAARAKARRARLATEPAEPGAAEPLRDALVLDADPAASALLCELLERFGFRPHAVTSIGGAAAQLTQRPFAAVFLDIALDDAGVALLQKIRALPAPWPHAAPAVLMVAARLDPTDRVRAALAGLGEPLAKPVGRGDVARALESAGVVLPADARRP
jgi:two-component system, cell cycle response regulator